MTVSRLGHSEPNENIFPHQRDRGRKRKIPHNFSVEKTHFIIVINILRFKCDLLEFAYKTKKKNTTKSGKKQLS